MDKQVLVHLIDIEAMELLRKYLADKPLAEVAKFGSYFYNSAPQIITFKPVEASEEPVIQADG